MVDLSLDDAFSSRNGTSKAVCFGSLALGTVISTNEYPSPNRGSSVNFRTSYVFQDAAIVAMLLATSGVRTDFIGTAVGDDEAGKKIASQLEASGVRQDTRFSNSFSTPQQFVISDSFGGRTWFAESNYLSLETLKNADLSEIANTDVLYVDWYDGEVVLQPIDYARVSEIPVFLNIEEQFTNDLVLDRYVPHASFCQATLDENSTWDDARHISTVLLDAGSKIALVTFGAHGLLAATREARILVHAPNTLHIVDTCGAGATFSAAYIWTVLMGGTLLEAAVFATAAASIKCSNHGLVTIVSDEIWTMADELVVEME
jgi:sugar/nucleoside kinase (ribokinase family)